MAPTKTNNQTGLKAATLAELRSRRDLIVPGPSGFAYKIRPFNLQRHAFAGGFPERLKALAVRQVTGQSAIRGVDDVNELLDAAGDVRDYTDTIVRQLVLEPTFSEPKEGEEDSLELMPAPDYDWVVGIAMGNVTVDGLNRNLWGADLFDRFREGAS